jgi:hypothetical protein
VPDRASDFSVAAGRAGHDGSSSIAFVKSAGGRTSAGADCIELRPALNHPSLPITPLSSSLENARIVCVRG